jgi:hypothetical protein
MTDTDTTQNDTTQNIDGLETTSVAMIVRYGERKYVVDIGEAFGALQRIRHILRDGTSDIVPIAHSKGLVWLAVGPGIDVSFSEVAPKPSQSSQDARKQLGLAH